MKDADDTVTGGPISAVHTCTCGREVVVPLTGAYCHGCGAFHGQGVAGAPDEVSEEVALSELPGGKPKRPTWGDT